MHAHTHFLFYLGLWSGKHRNLPALLGYILYLPTDLDTDILDPAQTKVPDCSVQEAKAKTTHEII